ncbi:MAG: polyprenyl synthetase family protein [Desulfovermiculus sp.]|nr:polyprenyl synthetase family protein [Desulfovermiculus sp.]
MPSLNEFFQRTIPHIESSLRSICSGLNPVVQPVAEHIISGGGKRLRPALFLLTYQALKDDRAVHDPYPLAAALELIHSSTLLHDDILDNAPLRRGQPSAHLLFGTSATLLAGDALLAKANKVVTEYNSLPLMACISEAIYQTATGEILEIERMKQPDLSREEYLEIIVGKTGFLLQACCQSGAIMAGCESDLEEAAKCFGLNMGIAFQLVDDALDYAATPSQSGKPLGGDLREGKLTLPLIFFLDTLDHDSKSQILAKIKDHTLSDTEQKWILGRIKDQGLSHKAREEAHFFLHPARQSLAVLPPSTERELLAQALDFIRDRWE